MFISAERPHTSAPPVSLTQVTDTIEVTTVGMFISAERPHTSAPPVSLTDTIEGEVCHSFAALVYGPMRHTWAETKK